MSVAKDRKHSVPANKVPQCDQYVWIAKPNPDVEGDRGRGHGCRERATHVVTFVETGPMRTEHTCRAHLGDLLDLAERRRNFQRTMFGNEWPAPVVVELAFTVDTHAAAYGRSRYIRTERVITGPVAPALVTGEPPLATAPARSTRPRRADRPAPTSRLSRPVQQMLF